MFDEEIENDNKVYLAVFCDNDGKKHFYEYAPARGLGLDLWISPKSIGGIYPLPQKVGGIWWKSKIQYSFKKLKNF